MQDPQFRQRRSTPPDVAYGGPWNPPPPPPKRRTWLKIVLGVVGAFIVLSVIGTLVAEDDTRGRSATYSYDVMPNTPAPPRGSTPPTKLWEMSALS